MRCPVWKGHTMVPGSRRPQRSQRLESIKGPIPKQPPPPPSPAVSSLMAQGQSQGSKGKGSPSYNTCRHRGMSINGTAINGTAGKGHKRMVVQGAVSAVGLRATGAWLGALPFTCPTTDKVMDSPTTISPFWLLSRMSLRNKRLVKRTWPRQSQPYWLHRRLWTL